MRVIEMIPEVKGHERYKKGYKCETRLKREQEVRDFIKCDAQYCVVERLGKSINSEIVSYRQAIKDVCDEYEKAGEFYTVKAHQRGDRVCLERVF